MECNDIRREVQSWLDKTFDEQQTAAFQAHVDACPECSALVHRWDGFADELSRLPLWEEPANLTPAVMAALKPAEAETEAWAEPLILFGLLGACVFLLIRVSGKLIGQLGGDIQVLHTPFGVGFTWAAVGLVFAGCLSYAILHKRVHAKYL